MEKLEETIPKLLPILIGLSILSTLIMLPFIGKIIGAKKIILIIMLLQLTIYGYLTCNLTITIISPLLLFVMFSTTFFLINILQISIAIISSYMLHQKKKLQEELKDNM